MSRTLELRGPNGISRTQELTTGRHVIGRGQDADIVLDDEKTSRHHAAITITDDGTTTVEDLASTNGTTVNGQRITTPTQLQPGDRLTIGDTTLALPTDAPPTTLGTSTPTPTPTPSRIERLALTRSARRVQLIAAGAVAVALVGVVVGVLFATGTFGDGDEAPSIPVLVEEATPAIVQIRGIDDGPSFGDGTGWVWNADEGLIVTNAHVSDAAPRLAIRLPETTADRPAEVVGVSLCDDLALLRVGDTSGLETMPLGSQADLRQGDTVIAIGFPATYTLDDPLTAVAGIVSVVQTKSRDLLYTGTLENVIQHDAAQNPGNSGGPLLDLQGRLVGVTSFGEVETTLEAQKYAIGVDRVRQVVQSLEQGPLGWTGMGLDASVFYDLTELGLPAEDGLLVYNIAAGSPAEKAGIPLYSLVTAVDGQPLEADVASYCTIAGDRRKGDSAVFTLIAPGTTEPVEFEVPFA